MAGAIAGFASLAAIVGTIVLATWYAWRQNEEWHTLGRALGFAIDGDTLRGTFRGREALLTRRRTEGDSGVMIRVYGLPRNVAIHSETTWTRLRKEVLGEDVLTGDSGFDGAAYLTGNEIELLGLLDAETRPRMLSFLADKGFVEDGAVGLYEPLTSLDPVLDEQVYLDHLHALADFAETLDGPPALERLMATLATDPNPRVRERALRILLRTDRVQQAVAIALDSGITELVVLARAHASDETRGRLSLSVEGGNLAIADAPDGAVSVVE